ncbi:class F sortase [Streptomyces pristinaespiralis]|uniref:class F sortase n=1 Tax=Streptomyces pristinaespiralis TaxID=38300 RepID=UPI0037AA1E37
MTATLVTGVVRGCTDTPPDAPPVTVAADSPLGAKAPAAEETPAADEKAAGREEPAAAGHGRSNVIDLPPLTVRSAEPARKPAARVPAPSRTPEAPRSPRPAAPSPAATPPEAARGALELPPSPARQLAIPAIMIESPVMGLGLDGKGRLTAPPVDNPRLVGWYEKGPAPGEKGTALVVGHRDTKTGPAIFLNLNALKPGDKVNIARADRRTAVFTVDKVRTYTKEAFPDAEVYGHTGRPELRLLTCGGSFDKKTGYSANVVVFAHLTDVRQV